MPVYYLTLKQLAEKYSKDLTKKELKAQQIGSMITINNDRIVIMPDKANNTLIKEKKI